MYYVMIIIGEAAQLDRPFHKTLIPNRHNAPARNPLTEETFPLGPRPWLRDDYPPTSGVFALSSMPTQGSIVWVDYGAVE